MEEEGRYYVVRRKAVPDVLLRVVETKRLLRANRGMSVSEATGQTGISRSSFYKYKEDIFPFGDTVSGQKITLSIEILDEPGLLADLLGAVARFHANIITIHQSIPLNGMATVSLSLEVRQETEDLTGLVEQMEGMRGVHEVTILSRE